MLSFQRESLLEFWPDAEAIFPRHWAELALNQDKIKIDIDKLRYEDMEKFGLMYILTARKAGQLVGYLMAFLMPHFHYKSAGKMALVDMYYVIPEERKGAGAKLFCEFERRMKEMEVVQMIISCKLHQDHTQLFLALGYTWSDKTFIKCLLPAA